MNNIRKAITMDIERIVNISIPAKAPVKMLKAGNITEIRYTEIIRPIPIEKIDKDTYSLTSTGDVFLFNHKENRAEDLASVSQSMKRLKLIINANVTDPECVRWITLTYKENMKSVSRLYNDFRKFNQRLQYYCKQRAYPKYEYIMVAEPQGRGAWHCHILVIFATIAPFIPNDVLAKLWGFGFVKIKSVTSVDNLGLYFAAYVGDLSLADAKKEGINIAKSKLKVVDVTDENGKKETKCFIKGARLRLYPPHMRLYRRSRGIIDPTVTECTETEAMEVVADIPLTYEKTIQLVKKGSVINVINYRTYNSVKKRDKLVSENG
jgi:hypothetical protein